MSLAGLLDEVTDCWARLADHPARTTRDLRIADHDVRITIVGDDLASLVFGALGPHHPAAGPPVVELGAWDGRASGVAVPTPPAGFEPPMRWTGTRDDEVVVEVALLRDGSVRTTDRDACQFLLGVPDVATMSSGETGAPLRRQLQWALWPDALLVHAAAVSVGSDVALLTGPGGSGKSSTAIACVLAGMGYLGDDYCAVTDGDPISVHLLHRPARLLEHELAHLPDPAAAGTLDRDKFLVWPEIAGGTLPTSGRLRTVLVLEPAGEAAPAIEPLRVSEALRRIAPSMLHQQHVAPDRELAWMGELLGRVPVHRLRLGADRAANPPVIAQAIADASR